MLPYRTADDTVAGAVVALVDIDEIKRSAEQIRDTALLNAALASINLAISSTLEFDEILGRAVEESAKRSRPRRRRSLSASTTPG